MANGLVKKINNGEKVECVRVTDGYVIPAPLVHRILWGIITTLVIIGGYMALWYVNDRVWKENVSGRLELIEREMVKVSKLHERITLIERDDAYFRGEIDILEKEIREQDKRLDNLTLTKRPKSQ